MDRPHQPEGYETVKTHTTGTLADSRDGLSTVNWLAVPVEPRGTGLVAMRHRRRLVRGLMEYRPYFLTHKLSTSFRYSVFAVAQSLQAAYSDARATIC